MRRFSLSNDTEGWTYDPSSIDEVIEARIRRQEIDRRRLAQSGREDGTRPSVNKGALGFNPAETESIRHEAVRGFFNDAILSEALRQERQKYREHFSERAARFLSNPGPEIRRAASEQALLFAMACQKSITRATGVYADLLTQAIIARRGRKDFSHKFRTAIWKECLRFAMSLAQWESAGFWVQVAWGNDPRENVLPQLYRLESSKQQIPINEFAKEFTPQFMERVRHASTGWLEEAERKINLRSLLSGASQRRANFADPSKRAVTFLLIANPELTAKQVCAKLDAQQERRPESAQVPRSWRRGGVRSWIEAYEKFPGRVKTYVSTLKRDSGILKRVSGSS